jgi:predicted nucleotidyltransferase
MSTPATTVKRAAVLAFVERVLAPEPAVRGMIVVGSVAAGTARPDSDVDAVVLLDPYDAYIVPAESIWRSSDGSFRSIFADVPDRDEDLQLDLTRLDLAVWRNPEHAWPEPLVAELSAGWWAHRPDPCAAALVERRCAYPEELRRRRLDEALVQLDQILDGDGPARCWETLGPLVAHDRLLAAWETLLSALFGLNRRWRPWRSREMTALLALPWMPDGFADLVAAALAPQGEGMAAYAARTEALRALYRDLVAHLVACGDYAGDPVGEAFIRSHDEPGRAWNMDEWNEMRRRQCP